MEIKVQLNQLLVVSGIKVEDLMKAREYSIVPEITDDKGNTLFRVAMGHQPALRQFGVMFNHQVNGKAAVVMPLPEHLLGAEADHVKAFITRTFSPAISALGKYEDQITTVIAEALAPIQDVMESIELE